MLRLPDTPNRESQEIPFPRELHPKHFLFRVNRHHLCKSWLELLVTWRTERIFLFWSVQLSLKEGAEENTEFCYSWDWVNEGKLRVSAFHQISVDQARNHFSPPGLVISYLWYCWDIMSSGSKHWYPRSSSIRKSYIYASVSVTIPHTVMLASIQRLSGSPSRLGNIQHLYSLRTFRISGAETQFQQSYKSISS